MKLVTARKAAFAVLVTTLAQVTPTFAGGRLRLRPTPSSRQVWAHLVRSWTG